MRQRAKLDPAVKGARAADDREDEVAETQHCLADSVHPESPVVRRALAESVVAISEAEHGSEGYDSDIYAIGYGTRSYSTLNREPQCS